VEIVEAHTPVSEKDQRQQIVSLYSFVDIMHFWNELMVNTTLAIKTPLASFSPLSGLHETLLPG
jgi:hypothetical protein